MGKITIKRNQQWIGSKVRHKILIDTKEIGILKSGESQHYDLEKGDHILQVKQWWNKTSIIPFVIDDKSNLNIEISYSLLTFIIPFTFVSLYGILSELYGFSYLNNIPFLIIFAFLFEVIIGRKLYIKVKLL